MTNSEKMKAILQVIEMDIRGCQSIRANENLNSAEWLYRKGGYDEAITLLDKVKNIIEKE